MRVAGLVLLIFSIVDGALLADTLSLPEVQILDKIQVLHAFGRNITQADTLLQQHTVTGLGNIVESGSIGYLKNYGAGNSAIFSNQGTAAQHNQIIWNGIPSNNSLLGTSDLSLMNVGEQNELHVVQGTTCSYWGGGAIGSTLLLRTIFEEKPFLSASAGYQSLSNRNFNMSLRKLFGKTFVYAGMSAAEGDNSFTVLNYTDPKKQNRSFSSPFEGRQFEFSLKQKLANQQIQFHAIYGDMDRRLSSSLTEAETKARQGDRIGRGVLQYDLQAGRTKVSALAGFSYDRIIYDAAPILDTGTVKAVNIRVEVQQNFNAGQLYAILQNRLEQADNSSFATSVTRNLPALVVGFSSELIRSLIANIEVRAETQDKESPVTIASGSLEANVFDFTLKSYLSGSYNRPGLNDLYWVPGGNRDLKPENGINAGLTLVREWHVSTVKNQTSLEGFYHNINDWIQWVPSGSYWSPVNYKHVISSGATLQHRSAIETMHGTLALNASASYTRAVNKSPVPETSYNKQLAYTPSFTGMLALSFLGTKGLSVRAEMLAVGARYTVFDESASLPAYALINVFAAYALSFRGLELRPFVQVNNLLNKYYESVAYRPREPLNFLTGFKINIL